MEYLKELRLCRTLHKKLQFPPKWGRKVVAIMVHLLGRLGEEVVRPIQTQIEDELGWRGYSFVAPYWEKRFPGGRVSIVPGLVGFRREYGNIRPAMNYTMGTYVPNHMKLRITFWDRLIPGRVQRKIEEDKGRRELEDNVMFAEVQAIRAFVEGIELPSFEGVRRLKYVFEDSEGYPTTGELVYYIDEEAQLYAGNMLCNNFLSEEDRLALEARCS